MGGKREQIDDDEESIEKIVSGFKFQVSRSVRNLKPET